MDWLILTKENQRELLTLVEFQSYVVNEEKMEIIADCADYAKIYYGRPILVVIIITKDFKSSQKEYRRTASDILKPTYIRMDWNEITERLNNLEAKILNQKHLTDDEALDMVFLPMFATKNKAKQVTEKVTHLFRQDKSLTGIFRRDIAFGLSIMIRKYFDLTDKAKELLTLIEPEIDKSRLRDVIDFEVDYVKKSYEKELNEVIAEKDRVIADTIAEKDRVIADTIAESNKALTEKDEEISFLKAKLEENGIK